MFVFFHEQMYAARLALSLTLVFFSLALARVLVFDSRSLYFFDMRGEKGEDDSPGSAKQFRRPA
jgi:hypothetical protein